MKFNDEKTIYITVNSPGEISGWMAPLFNELKKIVPDFNFKAVLLPCVFASGGEKSVLNSMTGVDIITQKQFLKFLLFGRPLKNSFFVHLGGDLFMTALLARKAKSFAWGYQWGTKMADPFYRGYFVKNQRDLLELKKRGISPNKVYVVGDLLYDATNPTPAHMPHVCKGRVVFMLGSRENEVRALLPLFMQTAQILKAKNKDLEFYMPISPYIPYSVFEDGATFKPIRGVKGTPTIFQDKDDKLLPLEGENVEIYTVFGDHSKVISSAELVVTIPGTKTGEAASLYRPMLVILPFNRPDMFPLIGIFGMLDWIPIIGKWIKGGIISLILKSMNRKFGYMAQPNILADREIVPELRDFITPQLCAERIKQLLEDPNRMAQMSSELKELYSPFEGASVRMADQIATSIPTENRASRPYFSIIICTHNRSQLLKGTIDSLFSQTFPRDRYELLVVDDGSTDDTGNVVRGLNYGTGLKYIYKDWGGRSATRNVGIQNAIGEIALFVDDDIIAPLNFLSEVARFHKLHPWSIVRGPIINVTEYKNPGTPAKLSDYSQAVFCTCNASAPLDAVRAVGGFDETFLEYGYEDNELGRRLIKAGLKRHFNMKAYLYHYKPFSLRENIEDAIKNATELARSAIMYYKKHTDLTVALATKITPLHLFLHKKFAKETTYQKYIESWKGAKEVSDTKKMLQYERKIRNYCYMDTIVKEMEKGKI